MFSQVHSARGRSDGGLGIGLALVKGLVQLHGGTIEVHRAGTGHGSKFGIHLPRSVVPSVLEIASSAAERPPKASDHTVLLADDNRDAAGSLAMLLDMSGYQKEDKARAVVSGFDRHLTKPVDPDEIEKVLQSFFRGQFGENLAS